jgi:hypothetical protein
MPKRANYADSLRDVLLALALIPIAGLHAGSYWVRESLERTTRLATDAMATTSLARSGLGRNARPDDPTADVFARDLLEAVRTWVRGMVRLPADSGIYFTEELERRLNALLLQIQPDAETDLDSYVGVELERWLNELDRLSLVARAEAGRAGRGGLTDKQRARWRLVRRLDDLRTRTKRVRDRLHPRRPEEISLEPPRRGRMRALEVYRARTKVEQAFRDAGFVRGRKALTKLRTRVARLADATAGRVEARAQGGQSNGQSKR